MLMIVAFISMKGGSGKSTLAAHAYGFDTSEKISTALVDMDPQGSSSEWVSGQDPEAEAYHITDTQTAVEAIQGLHQKHSLVILDGAGALHEPTKAALLLADTVAIPCRPGRMDFSATVEILRLANEANKSRRTPLNVLVIPSMVRRGETVTEQLLEELDSLKVKIGPSTSYRAAYSKASSDMNYVWDGKDSQAAAEAEILMQYLIKNL